MNRALACWKLARAVQHAIGGWWTIRFTFPRLSQAERNATVERWAERMLLLLGIRLVVQGTPPAQGPVLLVSNHVSWLDILAFHAARHVRFVAKSGVRHWPLIGTLATGGGTLYIERERKRDALRVVHEVAAALKSHDAVAVFPEGTTGSGHAVLPFHANLLQAAITTATTIQPIVLRYSEPGMPVSVAAQYIDDTTLVESVMKVCRARGVVVDVRFLAPEPAGELDRRALAERLHERVAAELRAVLQSG